MFRYRHAEGHAEESGFLFHSSKNSPDEVERQRQKKTRASEPAKPTRAGSRGRGIRFLLPLTAAAVIVAGVAPTALLSQPRPVRVIGTWSGGKVTRARSLEVGPCNAALAGPFLLKITAGSASGKLKGLVSFGGLGSPVSGWTVGTKVRIAAVYVIRPPNRFVSPTGYVRENLAVTLEGTVKADTLQGRVTENIPACGKGTVLDAPVSLRRITEGTKRRKKRPGPAVPSPPGRFAVSSSSECSGPGTASVSNGTHGTIGLLSGTGTFAGISPSLKTITAVPGELISGTVKLRVSNRGPGFAVAPLIWTASWNNPKFMWQLITGSVGVGQHTFTATIQIGVPQSSGTYHIIFAFQLETNGASVASATNWARGQPVWGDGNDIADFTARQIGEAQQFGCTTDSWLSATGYERIYVPADAVTIKVQSRGVASSPGFTSVLRVPGNQPWTSTGIKLEKGEPVAIAASGVIHINLAGMLSPPSGAGRNCSIAGPVRIPFVAPDLPCWSLLGRIGMSGKPFEVGSGLGFQSPADGQLYLGVNDNNFSDNFGSWVVNISVARPATPLSTRSIGSLPPFAFAGAWASYALRQGQEVETLRLRIEGVDRTRQTYVLLIKHDGAFAGKEWPEERTLSLGAGGIHLWWGPQNGLDMGYLRRGLCPPAFVSRMPVRRNVTITVPAGTFFTDLISDGTMSIWFDVVSGIPVKLAGADWNGFWGIPPAMPLGKAVWVAPPDVNFELTGTNIPTSCFHCYIGISRGGKSEKSSARAAASAGR